MFRLRSLTAAALLTCLLSVVAGPATASTAKHGTAKHKVVKKTKKVAKKKTTKQKAKAKKTTKKAAAQQAPVVQKAPAATSPAVGLSATSAPAPAAPAAATPASAPAAASTPAATDRTDRSVPAASTPDAATPDAAPASSVTTTDLPAASPAAPATPLFTTSYARDLSSWQSVQEPADTQRITVGTAPGDARDPLRPSGNVMRVELRPGDLTDTSGYVAPRAEVFGRAATPMSQSADRWPDPPNTIRWYSFSLYVPSDFTFATDTKWLTLTQWKGLRGGSPPLAIEIKRGNLRLGGARSNAGLLPVSDLGPIVKGQWTRLVVGMRLSTSATQGWVSVYRDGSLRVPQTPVATMDTINNAPDPIYLKQGIYRDSAWNVTHVLDFGPVRVGGTMDSVA
jgi:hypothetical protein